MLRPLLPTPLQSLVVILMLLLTLALSGCERAGRKKEMIEDAIAALKAAPPVTNDAIERVDYYADGSGDGIVLAFIHRPSVQPDDDFDVATSKRMLVKLIYSEALDPILEEGIFFRILLQTSTGDSFADFKLTPEDFEQSQSEEPPIP